MAERQNKRRSWTWERKRHAVAGVVLLVIVAGLLIPIGSGAYSAMGVEFIAAICPLGALETMLGAKEVMLHPLLLLALTLALVAVFGKAFCSWVCPTPYLQRFFRRKPRAGDLDAGAERADSNVAARVTDAGAPESGGEAACAQLASCASAPGSDAGRRCDRGRGSCGDGCALAPVGGKRDGVRIDGRHAVLAGALASAAVFGFPVFCLVCPVGLSVATLVGLWHLFQFGETTWGLLVFPVVLVLEVTVLRRWCRTLCPVAALTSLVSSANVTFRPRVDEGRCLRAHGTDCRACVEVCPEQVDPHSRRIPECTKCGLCADVCPSEAISLSLLPGRRTRGCTAVPSGDSPSESEVGKELA